jgi:hypothetical protein
VGGGGGRACHGGGAAEPREETGRGREEEEESGLTAGGAKANGVKGPRGRLGEVGERDRTRERDTCVGLEERERERGSFGEGWG